MFSDPNIFGKLAANPKTAPFLADQSFVQKVCWIQINSKFTLLIAFDRSSSFK
jgi:hypothetical protein